MIGLLFLLPFVYFIMPAQDAAGAGLPVRGQRRGGRTPIRGAMGIRTVRDPDLLPDQAFLDEKKLTRAGLGLCTLVLVIMFTCYASPVLHDCHHRNRRLRRARPAGRRTARRSRPRPHRPHAVPQGTAAAPAVLRRPQAVGEDRATVVEPLPDALHLVFPALHGHRRGGVLLRRRPAGVSCSRSPSPGVFSDHRGAVLQLALQQHRAPTASCSR